MTSEDVTMFRKQLILIRVEIFLCDVFSFLFFSRNFLSLSRRKQFFSSADRLFVIRLSFWVVLGVTKNF